MTDLSRYASRVAAARLGRGSSTCPSQPSAERVGVGTRYRQTRTVPGRSTEDFEVTVFEPASRLAIHGQIGHFQATVSYELEARALTGSVVPAGHASAAATLNDTISRLDGVKMLVLAAMGAWFTRC